jgi:hypothetical protein
MLMTLPASLSLAAAPHAGLWAVTHSSPGQLGGKSESRKAADDLLRQARGAIKAGEYAQAEAFIGEAEKLKIKYDSLTARFVDTPEKLRKLLAEERARRPAAQKPSARFPALLPTPGGASSGVPGDPYKVQQAGGSPSNNAAERITENDGREP